MSLKVKNVSAVLDETDETVVKKPIKNIKKEKEVTKIMEQSIIDDGEEPEIEIRPDKYITIINLCRGELNLSTIPGGKGKIFSFRTFGEKKRIVYSALVDIMDASPRFLEEGFYYIADKRVIARHGLDDIYSKLLTKEMIENIFSKEMSEEEAAVLYKSANKSQQGIILSLIIQKLSKEDIIDMNMVNIISRISGIDISEKVKDVKFYAQPQTT